MEKLLHFRLRENRSGEPLRLFAIRDVSGRIADQVVILTEEAKEGFDHLQLIILGDDRIRLSFLVDLLIEMGLVIPDGALCDCGDLFDPKGLKIGKEAVKVEEMAFDGGRSKVKNAQMAPVFVFKKMKGRHDDSAL
jgi:hypothetical protein